MVPNVGCEVGGFFFGFFVLSWFGFGFVVVMEKWIDARTSGVTVPG